MRERPYPAFSVISRPRGCVLWLLFLAAVFIPCALTGGAAQDSAALIRDPTRRFAALRSSAALARSPSSAARLFIPFPAAQLACCGVLGGQSFNGPQQGPVTQLTLPVPALGLHQLQPQSLLQTAVTTLLKLFSFKAKPVLDTSGWSDARRLCNSQSMHGRWVEEHLSNSSQGPVCGILTQPAGSSSLSRTEAPPASPQTGTGLRLHHGSVAGRR